MLGELSFSLLSNKAVIGSCCASGCPLKIKEGLKRWTIWNPVQKERARAGWRAGASFGCIFQHWSIHWGLFFNGYFLWWVDGNFSEVFAACCSAGGYSSRGWKGILGHAISPWKQHQNLPWALQPCWGALLWLPWAFWAEIPAGSGDSSGSVVSKLLFIMLPSPQKPFLSIHLNCVCVYKLHTRAAGKRDESPAQAASSSLGCVLRCSSPSPELNASLGKQGRFFFFF